jgi:hypothetical protein
MDILGIVASIDADITRLQQARFLLSEFGQTPVKQRGRPKNPVLVGSAPINARKKRSMSVEGKARIAAAQKARWAAAKSSSDMPHGASSRVKKAAPAKK